MSQGLTYEQAAAILGCHFSNVAKLIRKGELTSTGKRGASLSRAQVEALAERRAAVRAARPAPSPRRYKRVDHRPDHEHEWLSPRQVAELLGFLGQRSRAAFIAASCQRPRTVDGTGYGGICSSRWRLPGWCGRRDASRAILLMRQPSGSSRDPRAELDGWTRRVRHAGIIHR